MIGSREPFLWLHCFPSDCRLPASEMMRASWHFLPRLLSVLTLEQILAAHKKERPYLSQMEIVVCGSCRCACPHRPTLQESEKLLKDVSDTRAQCFLESLLSVEKLDILSGAGVVATILEGAFTSGVQLCVVFSQEESDCGDLTLCVDLDNRYAWLRVDMDTEGWAKHKFDTASYLEIILDSALESLFGVDFSILEQGQEEQAQVCVEVVEYTPV